MARFNVGQTYYFFRNLIQSTTRNTSDWQIFFPSFSDTQKIVDIDIIRVVCKSHHRVPVEFYENDPSHKADGFIFVDSKGNEFHNQYPTAYYGQLSDSNDRMISRYVENDNGEIIEEQTYYLLTSVIHSLSKLTSDNKNVLDNKRFVEQRIEDFLTRNNIQTLSVRVFEEYYDIRKTILVPIISPVVQLGYRVEFIAHTDVVKSGIVIHIGDSIIVLSKGVKYLVSRSHILNCIKPKNFAHYPKYVSVPNSTRNAVLLSARCKNSNYFCGTINHLLTLAYINDPNTLHHLDTAKGKELFLKHFSCNALAKHQPVCYVVQKKKLKCWAEANKTKVLRKKSNESFN